MRCTGNFFPASCAGLPRCHESENPGRGGDRGFYGGNRKGSGHPGPLRVASHVLSRRTGMRGNGGLSGRHTRHPGLSRLPTRMEPALRQTLGQPSPQLSKAGSLSVPVRAEVHSNPHPHGLSSVANVNMLCCSPPCIASHTAPILVATTMFVYACCTCWPCSHTFLNRSATSSGRSIYVLYHGEEWRFPCGSRV